MAAMPREGGEVDATRTRHRPSPRRRVVVHDTANVQRLSHVVESRLLILSAIFAGIDGIDVHVPSGPRHSTIEGRESRGTPLLRAAVDFGIVSPDALPREGHGATYANDRRCFHPSVVGRTTGAARWGGGIPTRRACRCRRFVSPPGGGGDTEDHRSFANHALWLVAATQEGLNKRAFYDAARQDSPSVPSSMELATSIPKYSRPNARLFTFNIIGVIIFINSIESYKIIIQPALEPKQQSATAGGEGICPRCPGRGEAAGNWFERRS